MRTAFAPVLTLILNAYLLAAADTIPSAEAKDHIGQTGTVCGKVADTRYLESGRRPTFLNFDDRYPDHTFTAVIFGENRAKFGTPEKDYLDKDICVAGKIEEYNGKPQIVVSDASQIKLSSK
jgi:micrococcal nuclease